MDMWEQVAPDGAKVIELGKSVFLEPCRMISASYANNFLLPCRYYSRPFFWCSAAKSLQNPKTTKRKRQQISPNAKELLALKRHQEIRKFILDAHDAFLRLPEVPVLLRSIEENVSRFKEDELALHPEQNTNGKNSEIRSLDFVKLGSVWQAALCSISFSKLAPDGNVETFPLFKHLNKNNYDEELIGTCFDSKFVIPKKSQFFMSDIGDIRQLIPCSKNDGYNLILIDPPWENKSVHRHESYPTLPNRYLLSLPLKELAHSNGAIVGLWVTNREKLRAFVDNELFPAWGIVNCTMWYWLKIQSTGEMISELDLPRQKPYECLLLGFIPPVESANSEVVLSMVLPENYVFLSIPGSHSRKPPVAFLLSKHMPVETPVRGLELFARELHPDWTSWGNEPLHFQHVQRFQSMNGTLE